MRTVMNPLYTGVNLSSQPVITFRLMDGIAGRPGVGSSGTQPPAAGTNYSGNYIAGLVFQVTTGSIYFQGYWWWVAPTGQDTTAQKFALWAVYATTLGKLVPGSVITSGTLTAGQWNYVPLAVPLALTPNIPHVAAVGAVVTTGFPLTQHQFGSGNPYAAGITNGSLNAYGAASGSLTGNVPQQPFSTANSDPSVTMPGTNDQDDLLWLDVQVTSTIPGSATSFRAWPDMVYPWPSIQVANDITGWTLGMQFSVSRACTLQKIWHFSVPAIVNNQSTVFPTRCLIWGVASQTAVAGTDNTSPSWLDPGGGAASPGDGWVYVDYSTSGVVLQPGTAYKVSTFHGPGVNWFGATANVFGTGNLHENGFTQGPLIISGNAVSSPGQQSELSATFGYPANSVNPEADWIDVEVTPA